MQFKQLFWASRHCIRVAAILLATALPCTRARAEESTAPLLVKTDKPIQQQIPLTIQAPGATEASVAPITLRWDLTAASSGPGDDVLAFWFPNSDKVASLNLLKSQFYISALASSMAWQEPWRASRWTVTDIPEVDGPAIGAALAVGMIATASDVVYPQDTLIIGTLNPDGSLGNVNNISGRLAAAAKAGMKRVVIPSQQRFEGDSGGPLVNVEALAQRSGLECIFAVDLYEATEKALRCKLPAQVPTGQANKYRGKLFELLSKMCNDELALLQKDGPDGPRAGVKLDTLPAQQQALWKDVFENYDEGIDTYRASLLYVSWHKFLYANAKMAALDAWKVTPKPDFKTLDEKAEKLRGKIIELTYKPSFDKNEIQSALVLSEMLEWLYTINAQLEGTQIFARQAFGTRSTATDADRALALDRMQNAVAETEYYLRRSDAFQEIYKTVSQAEDMPVYNRAATWLEQLIPTQLGLADLFNQGLKNNAKQLGRIVILDPRLATYTRVIRDAQAEWEIRLQKNPASGSDQKVMQSVGWSPGPAYTPPKQAIAAPPPSGLSDAARCLKWVNDYCEGALLDYKYLRMGGYYDASKQEWVLPQRATLQSMIIYGDPSARRGIAMAEKIGVDTTILEMIYERANYLRGSRNDVSQLESLRQFWRCALLGNMCWQLGYVPKAAVSVSAPKPEKTDEKKDEKPKDKPKGDKEKPKPARDSGDTETHPTQSDPTPTAPPKPKTPPPAPRPRPAADPRPNANGGAGASRSVPVRRAVPNTVPTRPDAMPSELSPTN